MQVAEFWAGLDLTRVQKDLDADAELIGQRKAEAEASRRELVEATKELRKNIPEVGPGKSKEERDNEQREEKRKERKKKKRKRNGRRENKDRRNKSKERREREKKKGDAWVDMCEPFLFFFLFFFFLFLFF